MRDSKEKRREQALDLFIDEALDVAENRMNITEPNEHIDFSEKHQADMERIFRQAEKKQTARTIRTFATRAACILLVFVIISGGIVGADIWRKRTMNMTEHSSGKYSTIIFEEDDGVAYEDGNIILRYLPSGFEPIPYEKTSDYVLRGFSSQDDYFLIYNAKIGSSFSEAEDENAEPVYINGESGAYLHKPDIHILVWHLKDRNYKIESSLSKEELICIAENFDTKH